ncbi:MAG TPA: DUF72 domain-containing protein [Chitinophagaceae bacterium]
MAKRYGKAYVGTSGWLYKHWKGTFYPPGLRVADEFSFYSMFFRTVELNNPFYRLPSKETFEGWRRNSPPDFIYVVKASRFITHMKKLGDTREALEIFLHNCNGLEDKLGPILFQLPPGWQLNIERLREFLEQLPRGYRFAFEFRNPTWYTEEVYALLQQYNCAFCIYQLAGHMSPVKVTADWVYLRLHGPTRNKYQGSYDFATLTRWAGNARDWMRSGKDVYIYFDNDDSGYAAFNAQVIEMMLNKDEPITDGEAKILPKLAEAIKRRSSVIVTYGEKKQELIPYLVALKRKGNGALFCYAFNPAEKRAGVFLLQRMKAAGFRITGKEETVLRVEAGMVHGEHEDWRLVYRTVLKEKPPVKRKANRG